MWCAEQVANQLNKGKDPANIKVPSNLSQIKQLRAKQIFEMYKYLQGRQFLFLNSFKAAGITGAVDKANGVFHIIRAHSSFLYHVMKVMLQCCTIFANGFKKL